MAAPQPKQQQPTLELYQAYEGLKRARCDRAMAAYFVKTGHAYQAARGDALKALAVTLSGNRYAGCSTDTIRSHIDQMYDQLRDIIIKEDLADRLKGSMTVMLDGWTSE